MCQHKTSTYSPSKACSQLSEKHISSYPILTARIDTESVSKKKFVQTCETQP